MSHYRGRTVLKSTIPDGERLRWASMKCRSSVNSPSAGGALPRFSLGSFLDGCSRCFNRENALQINNLSAGKSVRARVTTIGPVAHRRHAGNDDHGSQRGDQAIFYGGRAIFGFQKIQNQRHEKSSPKRLNGAKAHVSRLLISGFRFLSTLSGAGLGKQKTAKNRAVSQNPLCNFGYRDSKRTNKRRSFNPAPSSG
jgi:hypothetical protein